MLTTVFCEKNGLRNTGAINPNITPIIIVVASRAHHPPSRRMSRLTFLADPIDNINGPKESYYVIGIIVYGHDILFKKFYIMK